ncbi:CPBP family glutamic-type intramembrane protease [Hydrogenophaga sp.]|uniref:CPBP family glutamic-type intramembrane protease n=1 Tax=Hydrogenophaga sp. TaxID=1904254 RepID=UPI003F7285D9
MPGQRDFPYYAGQPVALSGRQWLLVLFAVVAAFAALSAPVPWFRTPVGRFIPALLFCLLPLAALAWVAGRHWRALFARIRRIDLAWIVGIAALNIVVTFGIGWALSRFHAPTPNPLMGQLAGADGFTVTMAFLAMVPQLLGEELLTMLPLLACLWWLHTRRGLSRQKALVLAWILSALPFALAHLPTYNGDLLQCLAIIGSARLVLTLAYLATKNLAVSTGAHILNDWALFGMSLVLARQGAG